MASNSFGKSFLSSLYDRNELKRLEKKLGDSKSVSSTINKENTPKRKCNALRYAKCTNISLTRQPPVKNVQRATVDRSVLRSKENLVSSTTQRSSDDSLVDENGESVESDVNEEGASSVEEESRNRERRENITREMRQEFVVPNAPAARAVERKALTTKDCLLETVNKLSSCGLFSKEEVDYYMASLCYKALQMIKRMYNRNPTENSHIPAWINDLYDKGYLDKDKFSLSMDGDDVQSVVSNSTMNFRMPFPFDNHNQSQMVDPNLGNRFMMYRRDPYMFYPSPYAMDLPMQYQPFMGYPNRDFGFCNRSEYGSHRSEYGYPRSEYDYPRSEFGYPRSEFGYPSRSEFGCPMPNRRGAPSKSGSFYNPFRRTQPVFNRDHPDKFQQPEPLSALREGSYTSGEVRQDEAPLNDVPHAQALNASRNPRNQSQRKTTGQEKRTRAATSFQARDSSLFAQPSSTLLSNVNVNSSLAARARDSSLFVQPSRTLLPKSNTNSSLAARARDSSLFARPSSTLLPNSSVNSSRNREKTLPIKEHSSTTVLKNSAKKRPQKRKRDSSPIEFKAPNSRLQPSLFMPKRKSINKPTPSESTLNSSITRSGRVSKPPQHYWSSHEHR